MGIYCPLCTDSARHIEDTEVTIDGEYKRICTCDACDILFYIILPPLKDRVPTLAECGGAPEEDHE
jgi:hypothetical protein